MKHLYHLTFTTVLLFLATLHSLGQITPAQVPIKPNKVPQFVDPLPHFAGNRIDASGGKLYIKYVPVPDQIAVSTGTQLATGKVGVTPNAGKARFWGYSVSTDNINFTKPNWPAFTVVAKKGVPVDVVYSNELYNETYANVNLIVDQTVHWAAPLGMDMMNMMPYMGPVPVAPHLHGGEVASESDGGPDAWFTPGYQIKGPSWQNGVDENYHYPNTQEEATLWYHDHALGATRLNVYAGLAGFYFLKGDNEENAKLPGWSGDDLVQEVAPVGKTGVFNPQPYLPEIEVVFQDRMFDTNGQLYYPNLPTNPMIHPYWTPEFLGDIITVNGKTWPYLSVAPRKYRFRLLNGSNARFYQIWLQDVGSGANGPAIIQIGTDGGLLDSPVIVNGKLLLAPGERADVIIDFTNSAPGQVWTVRNSARAPFPAGAPASAATTGRLMQFVVNGKMVSKANPALAGSDKSLLPAALRPTPLVKLTNFAGVTNVIPDLKRQITLNEVMGMGGPLEVLMNNTKWMDAVTENPQEGTTELWQIINMTADAHPIHLHLVQFQLVSRQAFDMKRYTPVYNAAFTGGMYIPSVGSPLPYNTKNADQAVGGNPAITPFLVGPVKPALPNEMGWKDTYIVYPGEVTTFAVRFAPTDLPLTTPQADLRFAFDPSAGPGYVWHCHIIDHEDNEMMRPYTVVRNPGLAAKSNSNKGKYTPEGGTSAAKPEAIQYNKIDLTSNTVLYQNYPNPFNNETEIRFNIPEDAHVRLTLFNQLGQKVKVLIDANAPAGSNFVKLYRVNLTTGVYYYQLETGTFKDVKKMVVAD